MGSLISSVVGSAIVGPVAYALLYLLQYIGGLFFILGGFLTSFALDFNLRILEANELVKVGWGIVRDVANLGFVLIIIIIAFATILRREQYGAKKLLPKLIAAAIIVNFSLAIAGVIIDFSHVLTKYFLKPIGDTGNVHELVKTIGGAFDPQNLIIPESDEPSPLNPDEEEVGSFEKFSTGVLLNIAALLFTVIFTFTAAFVLIVLAFMLLLRYLWLSFLLILAPITWLFWVIPALSDQFKKWWNKFFEWVFFAPAVSFFLYLVLKSITVISEGGGAVTAEQFFSGGVLRVIMNQGAKMILLVGLLIGGLIAAKNMSIGGAKGAIGLAGKVQGGATKWAGRQTLRAGTALPRSATGQKFAAGLQKTGAGWGTRGRLGKLGKFVTTPVRQLGTLVSTVGVQQGEQLIKQAEKQQGGLSDKQLALRIHTMGRDQQIAALIRLSKNKNLNLIPNFAGFISDPKTRQGFERYGRGKEYGDMEKTFGANTAMLTGKDEKGKPISREEATAKFRESYSIRDYDKLQGNILSKFDKIKNNLGLAESEHEELRGFIQESIFRTHPGAISKVRTALKGDNLRKFQQALDQFISNYEQNVLDEEIEVIRDKEKIKIPRHEATIQEKIKWIEQTKPDETVRTRGLYNAQKNFAGSLLGGFAGFPPETPEEKTETT